MTPIEISGALLVAMLPAREVPELRDEDVRQEVQLRLSEVGCELIYSHHFDCWTARLARGLPDINLNNSPNALDTKDLAVLAVCWLYLRFLPMENSRLPIDEDGLFPADETAAEVPLDPLDVVGQLPTLHPRAIEISITKLKRTKFLVQRDGQLHAGPMMDALDEVRASEHARRLLLRHQRLLRARRTTGGADRSTEEQTTGSTVDGGSDDAAD
jgi:hypothetical protein